MADRTVLEKLKFKPSMSAAILFAPAGVDLGAPTDPSSDPHGADFVLLFASTQAEAVERLGTVAPAIGPKTLAWIGYPRGSKAKGLDISRDTLFTALRDVGLTANANFSIDDTWSAVRFRPLKPGE